MIDELVKACADRVFGGDVELPNGLIDFGRLVASETSATVELEALVLLRRIAERWQYEYHCCANSDRIQAGHTPGCPLEDALTFLEGHGSRRA